MAPGSVILLGLAGYLVYAYATGQDPLAALGLTSVASAAGRTPPPPPVMAGPSAAQRALGTATGLAGSAAGIGVSAGLSGAAIAATAGIAAGAVLLSWAIMSKGLFRGGWEGIEGNRLRDDYLNQFFVLPAMPAIGYGGGPAYDNRDVALGQLILRLNMAPLLAAGQSEDEAWRASEPVRVRLQDALYRADSESEWKAATATLESWFAARGFTVQR